jgi:hypothetical protein
MEFAPMMARSVALGAACNQRAACARPAEAARTAGSTGAPNGDSVSHAVIFSASHGRLKKNP